MKEIYDYIVIGSGLGGLSVASLLAQKKKKVLVLEKHYIAGGFATNFKRKDFEFDVSLHQTGGIKKTFYNKILKELKIFHRLQWIKHEYLFEKKINNKTIRIHNGDIKTVRKELYLLYPKRRLQIYLYFLFMEVCAIQLKIFEYMHSNYITSPIVMIFAPVLCPLVVFSNKIKIDSILRIFKEEELKNIILTLVGYHKENEKELTLDPFIFASYGFYFDGGYYVKGGGQKISDTLKDIIIENGGEVKTLQDVDKILCENKKVIGVETRKQEKFYSKNIICNTNPYVVYNRFLRGQPVKRAHLDAYENGMSFVGAYIGLDCKIKELSEEFKDSYELFLEDMAITIHSNIDSGFCSENKSTMDVFIIQDKSSYAKLDRWEYRNKKNEIQKEIIEKLKKYFKNIDEHIAVFKVATPRTVEKFTSNPDGSIYGFKSKKGQAGFDRLKFQDINFKNLYFSSAYTRFGGGYEGTIRNGYYLYQKLIGNDKIRFIMLITFIIGGIFLALSRI